MEGHRPLYCYGNLLTEILGILLTLTLTLSYEIGRKAQRQS